MQQLTPLECGQYYHIYNRGNNGENIFIEERNYAHFFNLYTKYVEPVAETFAYCLMRNHFHLLVCIKDLPGFGNLEGLNPTQQFSNFFNSYAKSINKAYQRTGSLFQKRFGRILVTSPRYFECLVHYIHFNPQKHGFVADFREYPYSSYRAMLSDKPTRLKREQVLEWFGGKAAFEQAHRDLPGLQDLAGLESIIGADAD